MSVQELETAVSNLSREELTSFQRWFEEYWADEWDRQIERDATSGRLDAFLEKLEQENQGQPSIPLDEVLNQEKLS